MLRKLTLDDCLHVVRRMRAEDRACVRAAMGPDVTDDVFAVNRLQTHGPAWSLLQDGEPVAVFGLSIADWQAVAWLVATPHVSMHSWRKLVRHARTVRSNLPGTPVHRVEAHVLAAWANAARFAQRLGLVHEGTRCAAGSGGEDIQTYGLVVKGTK